MTDITVKGAALAAVAAGDFSSPVSYTHLDVYKRQAVYDAGFPVLTRHNHSLYIASYPTGRDAAVSGPDLDFVWQNDSASDVLVRLSCVDGSVTATLYGVDPGYKVSTTTGDWGEGRKYETRTTIDDTLAPNTSYVKTRGTDAVSYTHLDRASGGRGGLGL